MVTHPTVARSLAQLIPLATLAAAATLAGCTESATGPAKSAAVAPPVRADDVGALPDVTVAVRHELPRLDETAPAATNVAAVHEETTAWYVTTVKDPEHGGYTAAVERLSLNHLAFVSASNEQPRAVLTLVLRDGRPSDLVLSLERGQFECTGHGKDNSCSLNVAVDGAKARGVRFAVPRHWQPNYLHLAGGADSRRLLATLGRSKRLVIQSSFKDEEPAEMHFALNGLSPAIAKVVRHTVASAQLTASNGG